MNLIPEELQLFRAQRMAASTEAAAFNFALCAQIMTVILAQQLLGTAFPIPLPTTMTHDPQQGELGTWLERFIRTVLRFYGFTMVTTPCKLET
jgi:hypothetical protein